MKIRYGCFARFVLPPNWACASARKPPEPIPRLATLLNDIPPARLFEESLKLLQAGYGYETYKLLCEYHLFQPLFPTITRYFTENGDSPMERIIEQVLKNTDTRNP